MNVISWSGGKDSTACIILAHEHNEPIDLIIFSEVMFSDEISGELPEHIDFVYKAIKRFEEWGYKTEILHSNITYLDTFYHIIKKSKIPVRNGKMSGFPLSGMCVINRDCKIKQIKEWNKNHPDAVHYVGIAIDEPLRLERCHNKNQISLLEKYNLTEKDAYKLCEEYDLLSPIYKFTGRGGCWFCPNAKDDELRNLRNNHNDLWQKLLELEDTPNILGDKWNKLNNISIHDKDRQFRAEEQQIKLF